MREFDTIVVGGGSGTLVGTAAADEGDSVAVVEPGPLGGACVTRGCVPSKALIHRADLLEEIRRAERFGIDATVEGVDLAAITEEVRDTVYGKAERMEEELRDSENHALYQTEGRFVDERTLEVGDERIRGERVIVAAGARPLIPPIDGIDDVDYLTSTEALWLDEPPEHLIVIGGGYIGTEMGHFYGSLGSEVTIVGRSDVLAAREDADVSEALTAAFEDREEFDVRTGHAASEVEEENGEFVVTAETDDGEESEIRGDELLVATGRQPNADRLEVENAGIETDDDGYVETNEYLETTADGVWALGDIAGPPLFKHAADYEARHVAMNAVDGERRAVDYDAVAHAIFTSPQVASVGKTEGELDDEGVEYEVGRFEYTDAPLGLVSKDDRGFVKVLAGPDGEILGCHVFGSHASTLVHEVVMAMSSGSGTVNEVVEAVHVHPALNEVVLGAFDEVATVPHTGSPDWSDASTE